MQLHPTRKEEIFIDGNTNEDRPMHEATCADCGGVAKVPFEPSGDRPVYCKDCFAKQRSNRSSFGGDRGERKMHDAVCADCNKETQVPFEPRGDRPVYCRDCFDKHRN